MKRFALVLCAVCLGLAICNIDVGALSGSSSSSSLENKTTYTYPNAADPGNMTANSPAFTYNTDSIELIAANAITTDFWITGISIGTTDDSDDWQVKLYRGNLGSETVIATVSIPMAQGTTGSIAYKFCIDPIRVPANSRVGFQCGNGDGDSGQYAWVYIDVKY